MDKLRKELNHRLKAYSILLSFFVIVPFVVPINAYNATSVSSDEILTTPHGFNMVINNTNHTNIIEDVRFFSNRSRFTGYQGFFEAAQYVASKFSGYGLQPYGEEGTYFEYFNITTPIDHGAFISLENGKVIKVYSLYPNFINPSPYQSPEDGDTLIYIGDGELEDFEGLNVTGKFVLMGFSSRWYFYLAMANGAKGVIFVPENPNLLIRPEAEQKIVLVPVYFPRLYVELEDGGEELLYLAHKEGKNGIKVHIKSDMTWEDIRVPNVVGFIEGEDVVLSKQIIVISAFYDSWSIVPALSPGATDSLGISDLLELTRFLGAHRPKRSVLIVALAGHYQSLWGSREFVERHFDELQSRIISFVGIDLASESDQIGIYGIGSAYTYSFLNILQLRYSWLVSKFFNEYLPEMQMILGQSYGINFVDGTLGSHPSYIGSVRPFEPGTLPYFALSSFHNKYLAKSTFLFDSDPFVLALYGGGFTYHTSDAFRTYQKTPADTWSKVNFENLWPQINFIHCTLWAFLCEREIRLFGFKSRISDDWGYVALTVQVSEYNMSTDYYDPISLNHRELCQDTLVCFTSDGLSVISKVDKEGKAIIHGLKPYLAGAVDAFVVERLTGRITWSTDLGVWQAPNGKAVPLSSHPHQKVISIFPCASIALIFAFNPIDFRLIPTIVINDAIAHGPMIRQNMLQADLYFMAFVRPDIPTELILSMGETLPVGVINDADISNPNGKGYILKQGEMQIFGPDKIVESMKGIINARYINLRSFYTYTPATEIFSSLSQKYSDLFERSSKGDVSRGLGYSYPSWSFLLGLYSSVMNLIWQVVLTLSVFFVLTIPLSIIIERLIFSFEGKKRFLALSSIIVISNLILSAFHPGFSIATNSTLNLLCLALFVVLLPLLGLMFNESYSSAKSIRERVMGHHFTEISHSGLFSSAMSMGVENMKRRRFRTVLTLLSISLIVFSVVLLSSVTISPQLISGTEGIIKPSSYSGLLVRATPWSPINEGVYITLKSNLFGKAALAPRGFLYPPPLPLPRAQAMSTGMPYIILSPKMRTQIYGIVALSHEEPEVSGIDKILMEGRWFIKEDVFAVILPDTVAQSLSDELGQEIGIKSNVSLWGLNLKVVGIVSSTNLNNFFNPDGETLMPIDPESRVTITPPHFDASKVLIVPYNLYSRIIYFTPVSSIGIKVYEKSMLKSLTEDLPLQLSYRIYVAQEAEIGMSVLSKQLYSIVGAQFLIAPTVIATFTILNFMLGSLHERTSEIPLYNAIGMSPSHISMSFMTESVAYAVPAVFSGYLSGILATALLIRIGAFPKELYPNFSSYVILIVSGFSLLIVIGSSLYPSLLAARLAVPSRVRRWVKMTEKPKGDVWEIPIPLTVDSKDEVLGIFAFLREFFSYAVERESLFTSESIEAEELIENNTRIMRLVVKGRQAPYDLGIMSELVLTATKSGTAPIVFSLIIRRLSGYASSWKTSSAVTADDIRKQVLIWRSLPPDGRKKYIDLGKERRKDG